MKAALLVTLFFAACGGKAKPATTGGSDTAGSGSAAGSGGAAADAEAPIDKVLTCIDPNDKNRAIQLFGGTAGGSFDFIYGQVGTHGDYKVDGHKIVFTPEQGKDWKQYTGLDTMTLEGNSNWTKLGDFDCHWSE